MENENYYDVLGIQMDSTMSELKKAYKNMVIMYHPDKVANLGPRLQKVATEEMQKINAAKEVLLDSDRRKEYDLKLINQKEHRPKTAPKADTNIVEISKALTEAKDLINKVRWVKGDARKAENFYLQALYAHQRQDFSRAKEFSTYAIKEAKSILYKFTVDILVLSKKRLRKLKEYNVDIETAIDRFVKAREPFEREEYIEAVNTALESVKMAKQAIMTANAASDLGLEYKMPKVTTKAISSKDEIEEGIPENYVAEWDEESHENSLKAYKEILAEVWADGVITSDEIEKLDYLKSELGITSEQHEELEDEVKKQRRRNLKIYLKALEKCLEDGVIDNDEQEMLTILRQKLNLEGSLEFSI